MFNSTTRIRQIARRAYAKKENFLIICPEVSCHFSTVNLESFDNHFENTHQRVRLNTIPIYQDDNFGIEKGHNICPRCFKSFTRPSRLDSHLEKCVGSQPLTCGFCKFQFYKTSEYLKHIAEHEPKNGFVVLNEFRDKEHEKMLAKKIDSQFSEKNQEFIREKMLIEKQKTGYKTYSKISTELSTVDDVLTTTAKNEIYEILRHEKWKNQRIAFYLHIPVILTKFTDNGDQEFRHYSMRNSSSYLISNTSEIEKKISDAYHNIRTHVEVLAERGSGWSISHVLRLDLGCMAVDGVRGGAMQKIDPESLFGYKVHNGIMNIEDDSENCLKNAILAIIKKDEIIEKYGIEYYNRNKTFGALYKPYYDSIKDKHVEYPAALEDLDLICSQNPKMRIHLFQQHGHDMFLSYQTKLTPEMLQSEKNIIDIPLVLGYYIHPDTKQLEIHYFPIMNLKNFFTTRYTNMSAGASSRDGKYERILVCEHCVKKFSSESTAYYEHIVNCGNRKIPNIELPTKGVNNMMNFEGSAKSIHHVFSAYADFETLVEDIPELCEICTEKFMSNTNYITKQNIIDQCKKKNHTPVPASKCEKCYMKLLSKRRLIKNVCVKNSHAIPDDQVVCKLCKIEYDKVLSEKEHMEQCFKDCHLCDKTVDYCQHSNTCRVKVLTPIIFTFVIINNRTGELYHAETYSGHDCIEKFYDKLDYFEDVLDIATEELIHKYPKYGKLTKEIESKYNQEKNCWNCNYEFDTNADKVLDHDHITGAYRGAACKSCNKSMSDACSKKWLRNLYIHNSTSFDNHFLIQQYPAKCKKKLRGVPMSGEKIKILQYRNWTILDSYSFLPASLSKLTHQLAEQTEDSNEKMKYLSTCPRVCNTNGKFDIEKYKISTKKLCFPFSLATSMERLQNIKEFPPQIEFKSNLTNKVIDNESYENSKKIFKMYNFTNMLEYYEHYCLIDGILLAEVMNHFRNSCQKSFKLSPDHYWTLPSFSLAACLKMTNVEIELISDKDMYEFVEKAKRGGLSQVSKRLCVTSRGKEILEKNENLLFEKITEEEIEDNNILFLDKNNLYGECLQEPMPYRSYNWVSKKDCEKVSKYYKIRRSQFKKNKKQTSWEEYFGSTLDDEDLNKNGRKNESMGYFIEANLVYPSELHEEQNDFPVAPANYKIREENLSEKSQELLNIDKKGTSRIYTTEKLCVTLCSKSGYITTRENLDYYSSLGMDIE